MSAARTVGRISSAIINWRECWVRKDNLRLSTVHDEIAGDWRNDGYDLSRALVIETVSIDEKLRGLGLFTNVLHVLQNRTPHELIVVESVNNPHLQDFLKRQGWGWNEGVEDYYWETEVWVTSIVQQPVGRIQQYRFRDDRDPVMVPCRVLEIVPDDTGGLHRHRVRRLPIRTEKSL